MSDNEKAELLLVLIKIMVLLLVIGLSVYAGIARKKRGISYPRTSVLLSYYTEGLSLIPITSGKVGSMPFSAIITVDARVLMYRVELPFSSKVHLLGIPNREGVAQLAPIKGSSLMERVQLEGNYDSDFSLFAEKNEQVTARYVLDPKAMAFTSDFCKSHNWEIIENELYFLQASAGSPDDPTDMFSDIERFVSEIRPAVAKPLEAKERRASLPYGVDERQTLPCPVCSKPMSNQRGYFVCPDGHGALVTGKKLHELKKGIQIELPPLVSSTNRSHKSLKCPSCGSTMTAIKYNGGKNIIDSCTSCPYRWLDHYEAAKIAETKPTASSFAS